MYDPRHIRKMLGKLRDVAAIDDDEIGSQPSEFLLDRAMQPYFVQSSHRKRRSREERLERPQLYPNSADRSGSDALCAGLQARNIGEVLCAIAEAKDVDFVLRSEVTNFVKRGDLVAAVRRKRDAPAYIEDPHKRLALS
jgi:hypothetical protein